MSEPKIITIDPEVMPKSAIAYALGMALVALGKDDLKRVENNITRALELLSSYKELKAEKK